MVEFWSYISKFVNNARVSLCTLDGLTLYTALYQEQIRERCCQNIPIGKPVMSPFIIFSILSIDGCDTVAILCSLVSTRFSHFNWKIGYGVYFSRRDCVGSFPKKAIVVVVLDRYLANQGVGDDKP